MNATNKNEQFEMEKNQIIQTMDERNATIAQLLQHNHRVRLLSGAQVQQLEEIQQKNQKYRHKLASNEFEIAIVGLEKAGKSTFANALIKSNILPSAPERCTFTSTRLVSGSDRATVEFYTEAEFEAIFQALLKEVGYGAADTAEEETQTPPPAATSADMGGTLAPEDEKALKDARQKLAKIENGETLITLETLRKKEILRLKNTIEELEARKQAAPAPAPIRPAPPAARKKSAPATSFRTISLHDFEQYFAELETKDKALYRSHVGKTDEEIKDIIKCRDRLTLTGETKTFSGEELKTDAFQAYIKGDNQGKDTAKPRSVRRIEIESAELRELDTAIVYDVPGFDSPTTIHMRQTEERLKAADAIILVTNVGTNPSLQGTTLSVITKNTDEDGIALKDKLFVFGNQIDRVNDDKQVQGNTEILISDVEKYKIGERRRVFTGSAQKYLFDEQIDLRFPITRDIDSNVEKIRHALIHYYETERFDILKRKIETNNRQMLNTLKAVLESSNFDPNFSENSEQSKITKSAYKAIEDALEWNLKQLQDQLKKEIYENQYFTHKFKHFIHNENYFPAISEEEFEQQRILKDDSVRLDLAINKINQTIRSDIHKKYLEDFTQLIGEMTDNKSDEISVRLLQGFTDAICQDAPYVRDEIANSSQAYIGKVTEEVAHSSNSFTYLLERFARDAFDIMLSAPVKSQDRTNRFISSQKEFSYLDSYYSGGKGKLINLILIQKEKSLFELDKIDSLSKVAEQLLNVATNQKISPTVQALGEVIKLLDNTKTSFSIKDNAGVFAVLEDGKNSNSADEVLDEINHDIEHLRQVLERAVLPAANLELAFLNSVDKQIKRLIAAFKERDSQYAPLWDDFVSKVVPIVKRHEFGQINDRIEAHKLQKELLEKIEEILHPNNSSAINAA